MSMLWKFALILVALWAGLVALFALMQGSILFPRAMVGPAPALPEDTRRLTLPRPDGSELQGVLIPGDDPARPVILGFGGNAWNAESVALFLHELLPAHSVAAFHFRGYAPSTGRPSASALKADSLAIHDLLRDEGHAGLLAIGFSIGAGVAAHLTSEREVTGAVLVTPFDSLAAVARQSLPWAPVRLFFRHDMDALGALADGTAPVALILAARDEVIPPARAEALVTGLEEAGRTPHVQRLAAGHNDIYGHPDFPDALRQAVEALRD